MTAFGFPLQKDIDPKPDNVVAGAILHTTKAQVGALLRAEPNADAQVRVTAGRVVFLRPFAASVHLLPPLFCGV